MNKLKKIYNFIFHNDSILSWIVNVILAFLIVKFLIYPGLGFALSTSHPLVAVVSGSMEHDNLNIDQYWEKYGDYYETKLQITKEQFKKFPFKNGFKKGDIMLLKGSKEINIGDVIVYPNKNYKYPIIHRVVEKNKDNYKTKGDHNPREDPIEITQPIGKAILRIPKLGYIKIIAVDYIINPIFRR